MVQDVKQIYQTTRRHTPEETVFVKRLAFVITYVRLGDRIPYDSTSTLQDIGLSPFVFPWDVVKMRPRGNAASDGPVAFHLVWIMGLQPAARQVDLCGPRPHL